MTHINILLLEDEPRAAKRLEAMVRVSLPSATILGPFESVAEAVSTISHHPDIDLVVSDIQLADGLSFEVFKLAEITCPVIFTTAYDQYAIQAFKANGIDYLLKPIDEDELQRAIEKFQNQQTSSPNMQAIMSLLSQKGAAGSEYKSRFMIKVGEKIKSIPVSDCTCYYSKDKATYLKHKEGRNYVIDYSIDELMTVLDPTRYFKVNRGFIVSHDAIEEMTAHSNSRLRLVLKGLETEMVVVARERTGDFKRWLDR